MRHQIPLYIKLILVGLTILILLVAKPFWKQEKGEMQREFESWLTVSSQNISGRREEEVHVPVRMTLRSERPGDRFVWELQSSEADRETNERLYRLLRQAQEASLFEIDRKNSAELVLEAREGDKLFTSRFNSSDVENSVKVANFLRLFEVYAKEPLSQSASVTTP